MEKIKKTLISEMPYQERQRRYEDEKDALLRNYSNMPSEEFSDKLRKIADKWKV